MATVLVVPKTSRAAQVLAAVLEQIPPTNEDNGYLQILKSSTEDEGTICVVYWAGGKRHAWTATKDRRGPACGSV